MWWFSHCLFLVSQFEEGYFFWKLFIRFVVAWRSQVLFVRRLSHWTNCGLITKRNAFLLTIPICALCRLASLKQLPWRLYGIHGQILGSRVQHSWRTKHPCDHCQPQMGKSRKGQQGWYQGFKWIGDLFRLGLVPGSFIRRRRFVFFVSLPATVTSWCLWKAVRKTVFKTHLPSATLLSIL